MALGIIKDINPNHKQVDVWALVLNNTVVNCILATYDDIQAIYRSYDYCVDVTMNGDPAASPGHTYDPAHDTFIAPPAPPIDWVEGLREDFNGALGEIIQCAIDAGINGGSLSQQNIQAAYNSALNDNPSLTSKQLTLIQSIYQYVLTGGG